MQEPVGSNLLLDGEESEIGDFQVAVLVEEEVLRLEIAVEDAARVAESDDGDELLEVLSAEIFGESAFSDLSE